MEEEDRKEEEEMGIFYVVSIILIMFESAMESIDESENKVIILSSYPVLSNTTLFSAILVLSKQESPSLCFVL